MVYPRAGGATPHEIDMAQHPNGLSPRWRGNPSLQERHSGLPRSIPALAGGTTFPIAQFIPA